MGGIFRFPYRRLATLYLSRISGPILDFLSVRDLTVVLLTHVREFSSLSGERLLNRDCAYRRSSLLFRTFYAFFLPLDVVCPILTAELRVSEKSLPPFVENSVVFFYESGCVTSAQVFDWTHILKAP